ncbi:MAG: DNA polymerase III beta subunit [Bacteroidetes bacterium]|nr:MAG: DNA polymerase III beta subunit [Bacteroidota bacterium]
MKVVIDSKILLSALNQLAPAISKNPVMAILETVLFKVRKESAELVATNLNITIITEVAVGSKEEFSILLPFAEIINICKVSVGPLTIDNTKSQIVITDELKTRWPLGKAEDVKSFPAIPEFATILTANVTAGFFAAMNQAKKSLPGTEHLVLSHICLDFNASGLTVVGTDSLTMYKETFAVQTGIEHQSLVSDLFVNAVKDFQQADITANEKFLCVSTLNKKVIVKVSESRFVNYPAILTRKGPNNCKLNKNDLEAAINKVLVYKTALNFYVCDLIFEDGKINIHYYDQDYERGTETSIAAEYTDDIGKISLNARQLQSVLSQFPDNVEEIELAIESFNKPVFLSPIYAEDKKPEGDLLLLIMPIVSQTNPQ